MGGETFSVEWLDEAWELVPGQALTFGRSQAEVDIGLDEDNQWLHRRLGRIEHRPGGWFLVNTGRHLPIGVTTDDGVRIDLPSGRAIRLPEPDAMIVIQVRGARYELSCHHRQWSDPSPDPEVGEPVEHVDPTTVNYHLPLSDDQLLMLVALCEPRLRTGVGATPAADADIARRFGWTTKAVEKKLAYLRGRLTDQGARGLTGAKDLRVRSRMVELLLAHGLVRSDDLELLAPYPPGG